jgi:DNA-binding beta-propeller fold protein YncE
MAHRNACYSSTMQRLLCVVALASAACSPTIRFPSMGSDWPAPVVPDYAHEARFAMTVNLADRLAFVSAEATKPALLGEIPVGDVPVELEGPHHLAASPDGKFIYYNLSNYVPGTGTGPHGSHGTGTVPGSLVKLDAATGAEIAEVLVDRSPGDVILSQDGKYAFVTHYDLLRLAEGNFVDDTPSWSAVAIVDTGSMVRLSLTPICPTAHGEGLSADESTLYVTCANSDELALVDVTDKTSPTVTRKLKVGPNPGTLQQPVYSPYALSVSPLDGSVWVSDNAAGDVRVYEPSTGKMNDGRAVPVGGVAMFGAFSKDGKTLFVPHQGDDQITKIDTTGQTAPFTLPPPMGSCTNAHAFVIAPDGQNAVLVCEGDHLPQKMNPGTAVFFTVTPFTATGSVQVGLFPDGAAWLPPAP